MWVLMNSSDEYYSEHLKGAVTNIFQAKFFDNYLDAEKYQLKIENDNKPEFHYIVKLQVTIKEKWVQGVKL